ncbi:MAG: DUF2997 domain-containing protein [Lentisphaerae bacterium]|nr:MAG: DUF2997 domain-containing protein [Lentisphaerota bacterium]
MRKIEVRIDDQGEVTIEVIDAQGLECVQLTEAFEKQLGKVVERKFKPEYYEGGEENQEQIRPSF